MLGEVVMLLADEISHSFDLYSSVASCLSGVELDRGKIILLGNAPGVGGRFRIVFCVMQDALDIDGIYDGIRNAGLDLPERPRSADLGDRLVNCFIKCETDCAADGRSCWTIPMSTIIATPRARSAAAAIGDPAVFVSVDAMHQGSQGGPVVPIVDVGI